MQEIFCVGNKQYYVGEIMADENMTEKVSKVKSWLLQNKKLLLIGGGCLVAGFVLSGALKKKGG